MGLIEYWIPYIFVCSNLLKLFQMHAASNEISGLAGTPGILQYTPFNFWKYISHIYDRNIHLIGID
jgi:hypothetical protein